jgi:hypothetical protein
VAGGVGILCAERGSKSVDFAQGHGSKLALKLAADREVGALTKEIFAKIYLP